MLLMFYYPTSFHSQSNQWIISQSIQKYMYLYIKLLSRCKSLKKKRILCLMVLFFTFNPIYYIHVYNGFQGEWTECAIGVCPNKECKKKLDEYTPYICNRLRMDIRRHIQKYYQVISIFFSVRVKWYNVIMIRCNFWYTYSSNFVSMIIVLFLYNMK